MAGEFRLSTEPSESAPGRDDRLDLRILAARAGRSPARTSAHRRPVNGSREYVEFQAASDPSRPRGPAVRARDRGQDEVAEDGALGVRIVGQVVAEDEL